MTLANDGKVGVGTTAPTGKLHVVHSPPANDGDQCRTVPAGSSDLVPGLVLCCPAGLVKCGDGSACHSGGAGAACDPSSDDTTCALYGNRSPNNMARCSTVHGTQGTSKAPLVITSVKNHVTMFLGNTHNVADMLADEYTADVRWNGAARRHSAGSLFFSSTFRCAAAAID